MRWTALAVDYEMSGKDLIDSVRLSSRICKILGGTPPEGFTYELFLDENGEKISKSRGNGLSVEEWLAYAPPESLALFMYNSPKKAKRLYFDVIPRHVDDYLTHLEKFADQDAAARLENPAWHIHNGAPPAPEGHVTFALLLNLASVCNTEDPAVLWGFITRYAPDATPETAPILDKLVAYAIAYYRDFVKPNKSYRAPSHTERAALADLVAALEALPADADAETIQTEVYEVGKRHDFENLRDWFRALYEVLLGQSQGPRFGSFVALYGKDETVALISRVLAGESAAAE
jgi:lysyl-tRNA synthetase class 1